MACQPELCGAVTGQWDFNATDLSATVGQPLAYRGSTAAQTQFGTTASFGLPNIGGQIEHIMRFPACSPAEGLFMSHGALPNGGGDKVNRYTLIMDVLFPSTSTGYRSFLQADTDNVSDGDLFVNGSNGIGISGQYHGQLTPDTWHRVAFTVDLTARELGKFIDGTNVLTGPVGAAPLGTNAVQYLDPTLGGPDGRWALEPVALLFADDDNETGVGYVNSIQFHDRVLSSAAIVALGGPSAGGIPYLSDGLLAQWDFNGSLVSTVGGSNLVAGAAAPASAPGVTFSNLTINGQTAQVAAFARGTYFRMTHGLGANGGGAYLNRYTLVMDVTFPSRPSGWAVLWQTNPDNSNDGDWFINPNLGVGISGNYGGSVPDGVWHRLGLVVDCVEGTFTSYVDGVQVQQNSGLTLDGRWALGPVALLFADEDQENAAGYVNGVQLRPETMTAADMAALGGPTASGIPRPLPPTLRLVWPNGGESVAAGSTQRVAWVAAQPSGSVQVDLYRDDTFLRTLGQTPMIATNWVWLVNPRIGDSTNYRVRIRSLSFPAAEDASDAPFSIFGSGPPANPMFGQPLQTNGGFESLLTNWQTAAGRPVVLNGLQNKGAPHAGTWFWHGGLNGAGSSTVHQEIDLLAAGFTASDLDGGAALDAEGWLRNGYGAGTFDDQVFYRVAFLDGLSTELSSLRCMIAGNSAWTVRTLSGLLPPGTRKLRLEVVGHHCRDADNDSMADDLVVRLQEAPFPASPQITKLPMLQDVRTNAMTLLWETDGNLTTHAVDWGRSSVAEHTLAQVETLQIDNTHFVHRATMTGLETETPYVYRVRSGTSVTPVYSFRTAPRRDTPFAVAWWADNHDGTTILRTHASNWLARGVSFVAAAGDIVNSGNQILEWHHYWFKPLEYLDCAQTTPVLFARGNHDGEHALSYAYSALPGNESWFAFTYGNSRFIFLDCEASTGASPEQFAWLQAELARPETQQAAFRILCFHKPPWVNLWNGGGYLGEGFVRTDWVPLFERYNVDMTISGHAHNYNRGQTNGVTYIITGGGGGYLDVERVANWPVFTVEYSRYHFGWMQVRGDTLTWQAIDENNQILDSVRLKSRVPSLGLQNVATTAGTLWLTVSGKPGTSYIVEGSDNLGTWTPATTNTIPLTGSPIQTNVVSSDAPWRFFRARAQ